MASALSTQEPGIRVMFGGDVMLGRIVHKAILRFGPEYPLGHIAQRMRDADVAVVNLECAITSSPDVWPGAPKAFYFGAPPQAVESLAGAGIDLVSLANNHALDYGTQGLLDTLAHLRRHGIRWAGAGSGLREALAPATLECKGIRLGMAAFCDHQEDFAAQENLPGIAYVDMHDENAALTAWRSALDGLQRGGVDWPILSLHWGPNMVWRPSEQFRRLAHAAIDMGWKMLFGHSAHVYQGIEIHRGCPIIYAAGDLVDDYYVDPDFRNDHQLLFELELSATRLLGITLHPVFIQYCRSEPASEEQGREIIGRMTELCAEFGTRVQHQGDRIWVEWDAEGSRP